LHNPLRHRQYQKVIRDAPTDEIKHIARADVAFELGMADSTP
jgi:hypothetical protein